MKYTDQRAKTLLEVLGEIRRRYDIALLRVNCWFGRVYARREIFLL